MPSSKKNTFETSNKEKSKSKNKSTKRLKLFDYFNKKDENNYQCIICKKLILIQKLELYQPLIEHLQNNHQIKFISKININQVKQQQQQLQEIIKNDTNTTPTTTATTTAMQLTSDLFPKDNLALVLYGQDDLRLEKWPLPDHLEPDEVLLKSHSIGICGTDLHLWHKAQVADFKLQKPFCLGHEPSAVVMKCGSNVKNLKPGDPVAVEPAIPCLKCEICREGRYNLCPISNLQSHGLPNADGAFRRYYSHPADFCYKLPESISLEEGACVEALAVVIHALRRVRVHAGDSILVCGAGPVGIMAMLAAKAFGCSQVCITDILKSRLDLAKSIGADHCYQIDLSKKPPLDDRSKANEIIKLMGGQQPDITIECTGVESSQTMAIYATKYGGRIAIVGLGPSSNRIPLSTAAMKEIDLIGVCRIKDDYPLAIRLIQSGRIDLKPLITHRFAIEKAIEAFKFLGSGTEGMVKVLVQYDQ